MSVSGSRIGTGSAETAAKSRDQRFSYPVLIIFLSIITLFLVAYESSISWLIGKWSNDSGTVGHGYLVALISAFYLVRDFGKFSERTGSASIILILFCALLSLLWLIGYASSVSVLETFVLPALLLSAVGGTFGFKAARELSFPILLFYTVMPAWDVFRGIFQAISVAAVSFLVSLTSISAIVEGNLIQLAVGNFEVAGGCSGLNYMLAGATLSAIYSKITFRHFRFGLAFLAIMLILTIVGNWLRIFSILIIAHLSDMQSDLVEDHLGLGWVLFSVMLIPAFWIGEKLRKREEALETVPIAVLSSKPTTPSYTASLVVAIALVVGPAWATLSNANAVSIGSTSLELSSDIPGWSGPFASPSSWQPRFPAASLETIGAYRSAQDEVRIYVNYYPSQSQGEEVVSFDNSLGGDLALLDLDASSAKAEALGFVQETYLSRDGIIVSWHRYDIGGRIARTNREAKLAQLRGQLTGHPGSGVVILAAACPLTCDNAIDALEKFARAGAEKLRLSSLLRFST